MIKRLLVLLCLAITHAACGASPARVRPDVNTESSVKDGDATAIIEGCGNPPIVGFTYCRVQEGDTAGQSLWFIGPPADCDQLACVFIKVWNNQSQLVWGGSLPKGGTRVEVPWKTLLGSETFQVSHRGFWTWNVEVHWRDLDGKERVSVSQGDLVLRVFRIGYVPLHEVGSDPSFVWSWVSGEKIFKMTSGLRAYVEKI